MSDERGLRAEHLRMDYGGRPVLPGLSMPLLAPGKVHALIGPNAAGKSTLLRGLSGLAPASGEVWLDGVPVSGWPHARRFECMVCLPQDLPKRTRLAVFEAVLSAAMAQGRSFGVAQEEKLAAVESVLRQLNILALADRPLASLSGGQRQLVGLAQALARRPRVLLLDEPTSALDLHHQHLALERLRQQARAEGVVVLAVLHDLHLAMSCADELLVMSAGELVACGPPREVVSAELLARVYRVDAVVGTLAQRPTLAVAGALPSGRAEI